MTGFLLLLNNVSWFITIWAQHVNNIHVELIVLIDHEGNFC